MTFRWALILLGFSLAGCSKSAIEDWATSTRDRFETAAIESRMVVDFETAPADTSENLISRPARPVAKAPPERPGDSLYSEPTSPFAPIAEPEAAPPPASTSSAGPPSQ
ncbi:MAG: hypothetical protein Q8Q88_09325 [Phenylobacterium sp.]|uniref:hypothetical protein n=1 Tax=Phenylobacterium sp. TaxID=1871053 RepID=UPI002733497A|nr:hypothetical protein [Phenylobacterium sp.]MDP3747234.1 hypothetical protein [Phenylobacterium sp.]